MTTEKNLLSPVRLGPYELSNRVVMAPLTRNRAGEGNVPGPLNATYYAQRASAGLIISEATQVTPYGQGYPNTPGIHSPEQVEGWKLVTDAVHQQGGRIFLQLWHVGRISQPSLQPGGVLPVAPSAIAADGYVTPRALETHEIPGIVESYRQGAANALAAGFDGVEIHGANGYLLDQFLHDGSNHRTDGYGGSIENRARLLLEVTQAVTEVWGADRVGVRLSPSGTVQSMSDSDPKALFTYVVSQLDRFGLAYIHIIEPRLDTNPNDRWAEGNGLLLEPDDGLTSRYFRSVFHGTIISAGGYTQETGTAAIASGKADLVAYGRLFISNPDLPNRFAVNAPLNRYDRATFYGGTEKGYTDYPALSLQSVR
ncbi:MAG TPA: alkene reductase [Crinalium sp.]